MRALEDVETVGVVGAGTMGAGIAQVSSMAGYDVVMRDIERDYVEAGFDSIEDSLDRFVDKGKIDDDERQATLDGIAGTTDLADLADCDLVVEAAVENMDVKQDIFGDLDEEVPGTSCWRRTPRRSRSPPSRRPPTAPSRSWASTS